MKSLKLLKLSVDICFILLVIDVLFSFVTYIMFVFFGETFTVVLNDHNLEIKEITFSAIALIAGNFSVTIITAYAIYLLRKLIRSFFKKSFFTKLQISLFKLIGQLIILSTVLQLIVHFFSTLILEKRVQIGFSIESGYYNSFFIFSIGLFFIYLSKLFDRSKSIQEENDLTV